MGRLAAGIAAALAERDIDMAATTGGNAAENNAFFVIPVLLEFMDKGLQAYDAYRLAKAIDAGDTDEAADIATEIALGAATDAIPANVVAIKIVSAVEKFGLAGLGAKIVGKFGDEAAGVAAKSLGRNLPFTDADRIIEVNKTLDRIESGGSFPYKRDEIIFKNKESILPEGDYREYTVKTPFTSNRGTRRIVQDAKTGKTYYTDDHYRNFIQIDPAKR